MIAQEHTWAARSPSVLEWLESTDEAFLGLVVVWLLSCKLNLFRPLLAASPAFCVLLSSVRLGVKVHKDAVLVALCPETLTQSANAV